ncbi:tetrathionate reductase family octaheme c-type cytochrome [Shewanella yunxiaonensis]|uniref:Tetrathionate reductase family octaheme c-type cytochrome n=1 Tax=Shewanella yunxiaonensis TaxID=2829809 RepID=A0ABX7YRW7_9GAMM|nr:MULTISPECIES: tetrathionate reductase family octaheme c-type cytochrome [Shewanella]MDF0534174.1 tetrathionate reductase family octaheme c-type cytochrome [Shewanella sp. A32]QUN05514.1 tetrathionate reductase family octaheme c-type cytochrome [Shewanella yunxiaonensis]
MKSLALLLLLAAGSASAAAPHKDVLKGPYANGPEVTKACLQCHEKEAKDVMKTSHWTWELKQQLPGRTVMRGKKNAINNFCVSIAGNQPRCTVCHAGYGWKDNNFDFTDETKVDCLVCHDTTGTYAKTVAGEAFENVDLAKVAQNVGKPVRDNCGSCHFYGGGGDAVKHGDLDSSMAYPDKALDVHMNADGNDFQCQDCHKTKDHDISGNAMGVSPGGEDHIGCTNCHDAAPHANKRLNTHAETVACQTCHIPYYARQEATKLTWDWSTAGEDREDAVDEYGRHTYLKKKGSFTWGKMVKPSYAWYNGKADAYMAGDKMDPTKVTKLAYPMGDIKDPKAKIYPFKVFTGKQIYDKKNHIFLNPKTYGKGGYWSDFDWDKAARLGMEASEAMKAVGATYSGEYGFAPTEMWWRINHMVSPKEQALKCSDCHSANGRLDWKALGYEGDPMKVKGTRHTK